MKKVLAIIAASLVLLGCGGSKTYKVEGNVLGVKGAVEIVDIVSGESLASATAEEGAFQLEVKSKTPVIGALKVNDNPVCVVFLDGDVVKVGGEMPLITVGGTVANDAYMKAQEEIAAKKVALAEAQGPVSPDMMAALQEEVMAIYANAYKENGDNLYGIFLLMSGAQTFDTAEECLEALNAYPQDIQEYEAVKMYRNQVEAKLKSAVGGNYTNIAQPNAEGKVIALKSVLKGNKYVLVDFWASWCRPCMMEMPYLLKAYGDYHEKGFEIYGVSLDNDKDAWMSCVAGNGMSWVNVSELNGWDADAVRNYGVDSIPANFLIDCSTGKIVAKDLRGEALQAKLAELFGEE